MQQRFIKIYAVVGQEKYPYFSSINRLLLLETTCMYLGAPLLDTHCNPYIRSINPENHPLTKKLPLIMRNFYLVLALVFVALAAAYPPCPAAGTATITLQKSANFLPVVTGSPDSAVKSDSYMTIAITNPYRTQLSLSFGSNAGAPTPVGNPVATMLLKGSLTQYAFPTGWAGRIHVGPNLNPYGSKIEGSYTGPPNIDISYVDGYSMPITCTSKGRVVTGCNVDLFNQPDINCNNQVEGPVCLNSAQNISHGPAPEFFCGLPRCYLYLSE